MVHIMDFLILILLILSTASCGSSNNVFNVLNFGAVGDGVRDDSQALLKTWKAVCSAPSTSVALIIQTEKTFLLSPTVFLGPCNPRQINVQVLGDLTAPKTRSAWGRHQPTDWITFQYVNGLIINGNGTLNGQGSGWWSSHNYIQEDINDESKPLALSFNFCNNLRISGISVINSPSKHVKLFKCNSVTLSNVNIKAPKESPNTDGIVIAESKQVQVHDCDIGTGDDCIAILTGSSDINITRIECGPGHGISIGSLGMNGAYDTVEEIQVRDSSFTGTQNGVRIKTWQGGSGYARKISFQRITLIAVENPIIIDQFYCPHLQCQNKTSAVKVSDISYDGVQGTTVTEKAINLSCDRNIGCTNIKMTQIKITPVDQNFTTTSYCYNAHGRVGISVPDMRYCLMK